MRVFKLFLFILFLFFSKEINAQKQFSVRIQFPSNINKEQLQLFYDNGQNDNLDVKANLVDNRIILSKPYYSKYATIIIAYNGEIARFWIGDQPAIIDFATTDSTSNPLLNFKLTNAIALRDIAEQKKIIEYVAAEEKDLDDFTANNKQWFKKDSLILMFEDKAKRLSTKKIDFVKNNGKSYYSFWLFRREFVYADYNADSLIHVYQSSFPDSLKNSFEGTEIMKRLTGRNLKKNVKAVDFLAKDITGKTISLKDYHNKLVLLTFWASWCVPCVEEIPAIKTMRANYPTDKLEIIFVTLDADSAKFANAVKKYDLNWTHIFNDIELLKKYGVLAIPQVYLIDRTGTIIYSREEEKDRELVLLSQLLAEKLNTKKD